MRKLISPILLLVAIVAMADTPKYLTLHGGGKVKSYAISDVRKITFGKQTANNLEVYLKSKTTVDNYPYSTFEKGVFEVEPSGVEGVMADNNDLSVAYNSGTQEIMVSSSQEITAIVVCNLNGMVVEMLTPMTTDAIVSLADYASGMYVVKAITTTEAKTVKIIK